MKKSSYFILVCCAFLRNILYPQMSLFILLDIKCLFKQFVALCDLWEINEVNFL